MKFNINKAVVYVRLTPAGAAHCATNFHDIGHIKEVGDGWSKWHMWVLMSFFGELLGTGQAPPFEEDVIIEFDGSPEREPHNITGFYDLLNDINEELE
jgi:hypothetical protein